MSKAIRPYGSWPSPIPIEILVVGRVGLQDTRFDLADDGAITWLESRPGDKGRQTLVRWTPGGETRDISPAGMNVRDRVHEYGGAPYLVDGELVIVSDFATGRLHRVHPDRTSEPFTPEGPFRYADYELDRRRSRILAVREDHSGGGEAVNTIVAIPLDGGEPEILAGGCDFVAAPRLSPDGDRLAWLRWNHPNLPWDGTELMVARLDPDGRPIDKQIVAGSPTDWISQPRWSPDGVLHFAAEPKGWQNLHRWVAGRVEAITDEAMEFGHPDWLFGYRQYGFLPDGSILAIARSRGTDRLYVVGPGGAPRQVDLPFTELAYLSVLGEVATLLAGGPDSPPTVIRLDVANGAWVALRRSWTTALDPAGIAHPEPVEYPTTGGKTAYGLFYRPTNPSIEGPPSERPPLIVTSHGGPTSQAYGGLTAATQLFTSRGFAVLDVDYGGSTGYGRDYRRRLEGEWGVMDVDDCVNGARFLADRGDVDGDRLAIRGGSASGYTTLSALAFRDVFDAGISYFGIGDLMAFTAETHKFESRYLDRLVGPLPELEAVYRERSPNNFADQIHCPVLILQGLDDRVVPPAEAERIVDALWERRIPHAYLPFEGEDHGFRGADAILAATRGELSFLGQVFGFEPADDIEPIEVVNLEAWRASKATA